MGKKRSFCNVYIFCLLQTLCAPSGSGCGAVGRAVASKTRGPRFESSHQQKFIYILNICLLSTVYRKDENKEKEAGNGPFFNTFCETFMQPNGQIFETWFLPKGKRDEPWSSLVGVYEGSHRPICQFGYCPPRTASIILQFY